MAHIVVCVVQRGIVDRPNSNDFMFDTVVERPAGAGLVSYRADSVESNGVSSGT